MGLVKSPVLIEMAEIEIEILSTHNLLCRKSAAVRRKIAICYLPNILTHDAAGAECACSGCSNASERYMMYGNPVRWPSLAVNDKEELTALKAALALGQMLNRVVVLPRFHCSRSAADIGSDAAGGGPPSARHHRRRDSTGAPPSSPSHECTLNGLLNVTAFDAQFDARYRENSFLRHPLVPPVVRDDRTPAWDIHNITSTTTRHAAALLATSAVQLSVDDVLRMFGSYTQHVLVFAALYRVQPRFDGVDEQRTFDSRVHKAFRRGTYRQL